MLQLCIYCFMFLKYIKAWSASLVNSLWGNFDCIKRRKAKANHSLRLSNILILKLWSHTGCCYILKCGSNSRVSDRSTVIEVVVFTMKSQVFPIDGWQVVLMVRPDSDHNVASWTDNIKQWPPVTDEGTLYWWQLFRRYIYEALVTTITRNTE